METLDFSRDELLDMIVALDNQACNCDTIAESERFRNLKWKLFPLLVKAEKEATNGNA